MNHTSNLMPDSLKYFMTTSSTTFWSGFECLSLRRPAHIFKALSFYPKTWNHDVSKESLLCFAGFQKLGLEIWKSNSSQRHYWFHNAQQKLSKSKWMRTKIYTNLAVTPSDGIELVIHGAEKLTWLTSCPTYSSTHTVIFKFSTMKTFWKYISIYRTPPFPQRYDKESMKVEVMLQRVQFFEISGFTRM